MSSLNRLGSSTCSLLQYPNFSGCVNLIFVRFRKPRWLPKSQSKVFKVREPTPIDPVVYEKMKEWTSHYNTAQKSILKFLRKHDLEMNEREMKRNQKTTLTLDDVYSEILAKNDAWNKETAKIREADIAAKSEVDVIRKQKYAERDAREIEEIRQQARLKVLEVQEWKEHFITKATLNNAIEEVLKSQTKNHEFALNPDGTTTDEVHKANIKKT